MIMTLELKDGSKQVYQITGYMLKRDTVEIGNKWGERVYKTTTSSKGSKLVIRTDDMQKMLECFRIIE